MTEGGNEPGELMIRVVVPCLVCAVVAFPVMGQQAASLDEDVRPYVAVGESVVALTGVRLIDGTGTGPVDGQTVLIEDGRISMVGSTASVQVPASARVIDLTGHTVMPGIVGMHNHTYFGTSGRSVQLQFSAPRLYLGSGVTTIRTAGGTWTYQDINMKRGIESGAIPGPRMHLTSPYLDGPEGSSSHVALSTPEAARRFVEYWTGEGVTWFKAYTDVAPDVLGEAIKAAHENGARFTGHLCSVSYKEAVALGIDNLEHGFIASSDFLRDRTPGRCPANSYGRLATDPIDSATIAKEAKGIAATGVPMTSTLSVVEGLIPDRMQLDARARAAFAPGALAEVESLQKALGAEGGAVWSELLRRAQHFELEFVRAGGILGAGVDPTGSGATLPGFGDQRNFELLVEAGFSAVEAIRILTLNGAIILSEDEHIGSIEPGKLADLVVLEGDPVTDPTRIRNVRLVFKDGVGYDAPKLISAVKGQVGIR